MKITTTKKFANLGELNQKQVTCKITQEAILQGQALKVESSTGGGYYVSIAYLEGLAKTFNNLTNNQIIYLANMLANGATFKITKNTLYKTMIDKKAIYLNGSNAMIKSYLNSMKFLKSKTTTNYYRLDENSKNFKKSKVGVNPAYTRQKELFSLGLGYNPDTKTTMIKEY